MQSGQPSRTALAAAAHRAAHQVLEQGRIFTDPLALRILGEDAEAIVRDAEADPSKRRMRIFVAIRSRFTEDSLAAAVAQGTRQVVVLGAGLDTYGYRCPFADRVRVFEVDHPATQAWKRDLLKRVDVNVPDYLTFAPVDFERQTLASALADANFDPGRRTFFTWLGVVPYLTEEAIITTLRFIAQLPGGAQVVFDYSNPPHTLSVESRAYHDERAARVHAIGEPWLSYFETSDLLSKLMALGFAVVEDLGPQQIVAQYFPERGSVPDQGGHIVRAATMSPSH